MPTSCRPMPADFPQIAPTITQADACRRWRAGQGCINRWHAENGSKPCLFNRSGRRITRPAEDYPADFPQVAPTMHKRTLRAHYKVGQKKLNRWLREAGVECKPVDRSEIMARYRSTLPPKPPKPRKASHRRTFVYVGPKRPLLPPPDYSMHGQAADHLRALAPVYRCRVSGRADQKGDFYRFGNVVLTPDELLHRAKAKGWEMRI